MRSLIAAACFLAAPAFAATPTDIVGTQTGIGTVFTTKAGASLYTYDQDIKPDVSACVAACAQAWPPYLAAEDAKPEGAWTLATRADGKKQWSFRGKPVYTFARDVAPGTTLGDGVQDIWHVAVELAPRPKGVKYQGTTAGRVAATAKGLTLYTADKDCTGKCLASWTPFRAAWTANPTGDWSVLTRKDDGTPQWAYKGKPVYSFAGDYTRGDLNGNGKDSAQAIVLQPTPALPPFVKLHVSDYGQIFTDSRGMTLYAVPDVKAIQKAVCIGSCLKDNFIPVVADANAKPSGNWTITEFEGAKQWQYRGQLLFLYKGDNNPGDINGDRFAIGAGFGGFAVLRQRTLMEEAL